ncbi:MAG: hypothetical protein R6U27_09995 [Desulfobacterales bacterium]
MIGFKTLFRKPAFQTFIACLILLIFSWPILTIFESGRNGFVFFYFFFVWGLVIVILLLIAIGNKKQESAKKAESEPEV